VKQAPALGDLEKARKQGDDLRAQLSQADAQLKASQDRVVQLEAQVKQAPALGDLEKARKQGDDLRAQLSQADAQLKASQDRVVQLEASARPADSVPPPDTTPHSPLTDDVSVLLARGDALSSAGDIASGRLLYERAAAAGNGKAALRLGETYDPAFLKRIQANIPGDHAQAVYWYRRALELGQNEAESLLKHAQAE
jgi:TPR repeat protein